MTVSVAGVIPQWTVGDRLRKARELTGLERGDFAGEIGISRNTVTNYEHDKVEHRVVVLRSWALRCGVSQHWLETGEGEPSGPSGDGEPLPASGDPGLRIYFHGNTSSHVSTCEPVGTVAA